MTELSSCDRGGIVHKDENIYYVALYRKSFSTLAIENKISNSTMTAFQCKTVLETMYCHLLETTKNSSKQMKQ